MQEMAPSGSLKIGDVILLHYNADGRFPTEKSGYIMADLSGWYVHSWDMYLHVWNNMYFYVD